MEWISVKEKTPKKNQVVVVQDLLGDIYIGRLYDPDTYKTPYFLNIHNHTITTGVAWLPLPTPFKAEEVKTDEYSKKERD